LLANVDRYRRCEIDLCADADARAYWLDLFESHLEFQLDHARQTGATELQCAQAREHLFDDLRRWREHPDADGHLDIMDLDAARFRALREAGIVDEFRVIKDRENDAALAELPKRLADLDAVPEAERLPELIGGMLAGNFFDLGVKATAAQYENANEHAGFDQALRRVPDRPWRHDDLDNVTQWWNETPLHKAVIFADNAGGDFVLGVLPLIREMLRRGIKVILTANEQPNLNDVTVDECSHLLKRAAECDAVFTDERLHLIGCGSSAPLVDLTNVSAALAEASIGADLVVLVGMGRSVESNFTARFTCHSWKVAMLKDEQTAKVADAQLFDAVFRAQPPAPG